jgi:exodeoxyribonuclease V beta subunit
MNAASFSAFRELDPASVPLEGRTLIEASAGTGKTHTITRLYLRLVLERRLPAGSILVVTFTDAAARELKNRIDATLQAALHYAQKKIPEKQDETLERLVAKVEPEIATRLLIAAACSFDAAPIHTIHSFCRRILLEHPFESGALFDTVLEPDESAVIERTAQDFWRRHIYAASPLFIGYLAHKRCTGPFFFEGLYPLRKNAPECRLLPEAIADCSAAAEENLLLRCFADVKDLWKKCREEVVALLQSPSLNKKRYPAATVVTMAGQMDALDGWKYPDTAMESPITATLKKLTTSSINANTKKGFSAPVHRFFDACSSLDESMKSLFAAYEQKMLFLKAQFLETIDDAAEKEKSASNVVFFHDLLTRVRASLRRDSRLREVLVGRYRAALVDEFQDTDPVQYEIFDTVFGKESPLFLVGDPKQAIYRFRGADIFAYFAAAQKTDRRFTLSANYRSNTKLLHAVNTLFGEHALPFACERISYRPTHAGVDSRETVLSIDEEKPPPFILWTQFRESADFRTLMSKSASTGPVMRAVAAEITELLALGAQRRATIGGNPVTPSDIAVLVHTNREALELHEFFGQYRIPSIIYISDSVFSSREAFDVQVLLSALAAPARHELVRAALATPIFGLTALAIDGLSAAENRWEHWLSRIATYRDLWRTKGVLTMFRALMNAEETKQRMIARSCGRQGITNYVHLAEILHGEELRTGMCTAETIKWLAHQRRTAGENAPVPPDEEMIRLDTDADAVRILTIHKSKGLEYPIVFCPFNAPRPGAKASQDSPIFFHDPENGLPAVALGAEAIAGYKVTADEEDLAEKLRLLYVALTRAKAACYCVWSPTRYAESSALAYLLFGSGIEKPYGESLRARIEVLSDRDALKKIHVLCTKAGGAINAVPLPDIEPRSLPGEHGMPSPITCRTFSSRVPPPRTISSYTSLTHRTISASNHESPDFDAVFSPSTAPDERTAADRSSIFALPHGAKSGILLHEILEEIDFSAVTAPETAAQVRAKLDRHGFEPMWEKTITAMLRDVTMKDLNTAAGMKLEKIPAGQCVKEMAFYLPIKSFSRPELFAIAGEKDLPLDIAGYLGLTVSSGHLKGFMDAVFYFGGKFYLVDWKSNFLGRKPDDYSQEAINGVMRDEHYLLQYHLYCAALHRHLLLRQPGYVYGTHFGGVYYLFLRGINGDIASRNGIFFDRPDEEKIAKLCELIAH